MKVCYKKGFEKIKILDKLFYEVWKFCSNSQKDKLNNKYVELFNQRDNLTTEQIKQMFIRECYLLNININT